MPGKKKIPKKTIAVIPARGGSKGIPGKNLIKVAGKPLIAWTIESALKSKLSRVIVSSESEEILKVAKKYGAEIIKRPPELAADEISSDAALWHVLEHLENQEQYLPEIAFLLQPTSPLRHKDDINKVLDLFENDQADSVISVYEADNKHLKSFFIGEDNYLRGIINDEYPFADRQTLPKMYLPNGAIYAIKVSPEIRKSKKLLTGKTISYVMGRERSVDLDTLEDVAKLEGVLKNL